MTLLLLSLLAGLVLLIVSAERFVFGASALAHNLRVSPLMIGVVIVGFGTSAPELMVSTIAAWQDKSGIAIGNVVGSNIANILLILGASAVITPIAVASGALKRDGVVMVAVAALFIVLGLTVAVFIWDRLPVAIVAVGVEIRRGVGFGDDGAAQRLTAFAGRYRGLVGGVDGAPDGELGEPSLGADCSPLTPPLQAVSSIASAVCRTNRCMGSQPVHRRRGGSHDMMGYVGSRTQSDRSNARSLGQEFHRESNISAFA